MAFKIVPLNARGLNSPQKRSTLVREANSQKADVLLVQETHFAIAKTPKFTLKNYNQIFLASGLNKKTLILTAIYLFAIQASPIHYKPSRPLPNPHMRH